MINYDTYQPADSWTPAEFEDHLVKRTQGRLTNTEVVGLHLPDSLGWIARGLERAGDSRTVYALPLSTGATDLVGIMAGGASRVAEGIYARPDEDDLPGLVIRNNQSAEAFDPLRDIPDDVKYGIMGTVSGPVPYVRVEVGEDGKLKPTVGALNFQNRQHVSVGIVGVPIALASA